MTNTGHTKSILVRIVYRNYRPIHKIYQSIIDNPPNGVIYILPPVRRRLKKLFPLYRKLRYFAVGRRAIHMIEKLFFLKKSEDKADIYHYICMIDSSPPNRPYVVDVEHIASLLSFTYNIARLKKVKQFLENPNCKSINCQSQAARRTVQEVLGVDYEKIASKVHVVYPSLAITFDKNTKADNTYIKNDPDKLKILFVGNRAYLKGLEELLEAVKNLNRKYSPNRLEVHVISDDGNEILDKYKLSNVFLYPPRFDQTQMVNQFYVAADVLISPTKQDTYGMTLVEALSCGTPVIATKQFAIPEIVTDGVDGILLQPKRAMLDSSAIPKREEIVAIHHSQLDIDMVTKLENVIENVLSGKINLKKLGANGKKKFQLGGRLSVSTRNKQLLDIYQKALGRSK